MYTWSETKNVQAEIRSYVHKSSSVDEFVSEAQLLCQNSGSNEKILGNVIKKKCLVKN